MMVDRGTVKAQSLSAREHFARTVAGRAGHAGPDAVGGAAGTVTAAGQEGHHDPVAWRDALDRPPDLQRDPAALVAEQHRDGPHAVAVDDRQVGVTQAGGVDLDEHFRRPRRRKIEVGDHERASHGIRSGLADLGEDSTADSHRIASYAARSPAGMGVGLRVARST